MKVNQQTCVQLIRTTQREHFSTQSNFQMSHMRRFIEHHYAVISEPGSSSCLWPSDPLTPPLSAESLDTENNRAISISPPSEVLTLYLGYVALNIQSEAGKYLVEILLEGRKL